MDFSYLFTCNCKISYRSLQGYNRIVENNTVSLENKIFNGMTPAGKADEVEALRALVVSDEALTLTGSLV